MEQYENPNERASEILDKLDLIAGSEVRLVKVVDDGVSEIKAGSELSGTLDFDVALGKSVSLNEGEANTTSIQQIDEHEGRVYIKTQTSVYELIRSEEETQTQEEIKEPKSVTTAKGSVYTYLEDGRTQRYKKATETLEAPQDLLVFIPPWEKIADKAMELYPEIFKGVENGVQFEQVLLQYMDKKENKTIRPAIGTEAVYSLAHVSKDEQVLLNFIDKEHKRVDFVLPTSREPKIGYSTFDACKYIDEETGETMKQRHIGNAVIDIEY